MEGLTLKPFRTAIEAHGGLGAVFTEFVGETSATSRRVVRRAVDRGRVPLVVQLLGRDPLRLARATAMMAEAGADGVDLNVGCPSRQVAGGLRGAALLRDLPLLGRILSAMVEAAGGVPVSAKVRAGWDDPEALSRIVRVVEESGVSFLTVHGRTSIQGFEGEARLDLIAAVAAGTSLPVVANGDIVRAGQALRILEEGRVQGVMIGRGAVRNPWIFAQLEALRAGAAPFVPRAADLAGQIERFESLFLEAFGPDREGAVLAKMKEIVTLISRSLVEPQAFRDEARRARSLAEFREVVARRIPGLAPEELLFEP